MKSGIYKITNIITNKCYIGSSVNPKGRWNSHVSKLRRGEHRNQKLQASFNKHGEASFTFYILENCDTKDLVPREQYWIETLKSVEFGYNLNPIAGTAPSCKGKVLSEDHKEKIRKSKIGKKRNKFSPEWCAKLKEVAQRPRPKQSEAMKRAWENKKIREEFVCVYCGTIRLATPYYRKIITDPLNYKCRKCYHLNRKPKCPNPHHLEPMVIR